LIHGHFNWNCKENVKLINKIEIEKFLGLSYKIPIVDVRSPGEFLKGHIPGSYNIPLFDDIERAVVGTKFKKEGRSKAILAGLNLIGPSMADKLSMAISLATDNKLLVHCWRGGMRSESMAWLFTLGGIETEILDGGYKSYRNYILGKLSEHRDMIVLGGLTGSGKTHILKYLEANGHNVIDLEGLANHKGSAFGALGQLSQPTSEYFTNILFDKWNKFDPGKVIWVEDESKNIGTVYLEDQIYFKMQKSPVIAIIMDVKARMPRLVEEYSSYNKEELIASIQKISKRLGGDNTHEAIAAIVKDDFEKAIEITLKYYDRTYLYGLKKRTERKVFYIETDSNDIIENSMKVLETANKIISKR
jgi:tRNA 2-selenouridine synthase